jgi:hypothetical protein
MTTHPEAGWHESLIAAAFEEVENQEDRERFVIEYGVASAQLERCPDAMSGAPDDRRGGAEPPIWWPGL